MLKKPVLKALNEQIAKEMYSSNLYLSMAVYFHSINLNGFANWMRVQAQEETFHAMRFFDYVIERGDKSIVSALDAPPAAWKSPLDAFEEVYKHEQFVTASINNIADIALENRDHATGTFLQWFINEQVEEEANASDILERVRMIGDFYGGLLMLDAELKTRVFVPPVIAQP